LLDRLARTEERLIIINPYTGFYQIEYDNVGFMIMAINIHAIFRRKAEMTLARNIPEETSNGS